MEDFVFIQCSRTMAFGFGSGEAARFGRLPNGYLPYIASAREEAGFGGGSHAARAGAIRGAAAKLIAVLAPSWGAAMSCRGARGTQSPSIFAIMKITTAPKRPPPKSR